MSDADLDFEVIEEASEKKATPAEVSVMHLRKALRAGILADSDPEGIARVVVNALQAQAWSRKKEADLSRVAPFLLRYGVILTSERVAEIIAEETGFAPMSVEQRGGLLSLSSEDRITHRVWMIGATGQTKEERIAERDERERLRRQRQNNKRKADRAAKRGPFAVNMSAAARALGLNRRTVAKLHAAWVENVQASCATDMRISDADSMFQDWARQICAQKYHDAEPWIALGISRATYFRRKRAAKLETGDQPALRPAATKRSATASRKEKADAKVKLRSRPKGYVTDLIYELETTAAMAVAAFPVSALVAGWGRQIDHFSKQSSARGFEPPQRRQRAA